MRVLLAGGGTAGHIHPALAIAQELKKQVPDVEFLFVGATGRMETEIVPKAGYPFTDITVKGFSRSLSPKGIAHNFSAAYCAVAAGRDCARILKEFRPDVAVGTGGYVCGPILRKAAKMGIPVVLHESNSFTGVTVKMLAPYAHTVCVVNDDAAKRLPDGANAVVTGNPLRSEFLHLDRAMGDAARAVLGFDSRPLVLSFGGSLGAAKLNETMAAVLKQAHAAQNTVHLHATGKAGFDDFCAALRAQGVPTDADNLRVAPYIDDIPRYMAAADLVVSRCGAITTSELLAAGKPSILIPSPNVAENHQFYNAQSLVCRGAAVCIEEKDLTADGLFAQICALIAAPTKLDEMSQNARAACIPDAAERIVEIVLRAAKEKQT